jgi:hypothetical protein
MDVVKTIHTTGFWLCWQKKKGKLPRNPAEYATELRQDMMPNSIKSPLPH